MSQICNKILIFRCANFANCFLYWVAMSIIAIIFMGETWMISYLFITGCLSIFTGISTALTTAKSSRWHIAISAICNMIFLLISMLYSGLSVEKLALLTEEDNKNDSQDQKYFNFSSMLYALATVSVVNGKRFSLLQEYIISSKKLPDCHFV